MMRHLSLILLLTSVFQSVRAAFGPRRAQWMSGGWGIGFRVDASAQYWEQWDVEATMKQFRAIKGNPGWVIINLSGPAHGGDQYLTHHPKIWELSNGTTAACPPPDDPDKNLFKKLLDAFKAEGFKVIVYMAGQGPGLLKLWHKNTLQHAHDWDGTESVSLNRWRQYVTDNYGDPDAVIDGHQYANMKNAYAKEVVEYYSTMYGSQIDGWWFDQGTYMNRAAVEAACRLGNPDAVVAMNFGQKVPLRVNNPLQEDYTFGHMNPIKRNAPNDTINEPMVTSIEATADGFITNGVNWDSLGHMFMPMGMSSWNQIYTPLNPLGWSAEGAYDWMSRVRSSGGAWTWNIPRANYMPALGAGTGVEENMSQLRFDFVEFANLVAEGFSQSPSESPSSEPTSVPSEGPSRKPSTTPTESIEPSPTPSKQPTLSAFPSLSPTKTPSESPKPSSSPSIVPTTSINPTPTPSGMPSGAPTSVPSNSPSQVPSLTPTTGPSSGPSTQPSSKPSLLPSREPSGVPSKQPSDVPSHAPSDAPSLVPTASIRPSNAPSNTLSKAPSFSPSLSPSSTPSITLSKQPSSSPSLSPTRTPSLSPSNGPSGRPSGRPSLTPSLTPSTGPSKVASVVPSVAPTHELYSASPTLVPSGAPSMAPSLMPSSAPSIANSTVPSLAPSGSPSEMPSGGPSESPSLTPSVPPSSIPSGSPSSSPGPTVSNVPSLGPSGSPSQSPTVSSPPSVSPTSSASPTQSSIPTMVPSSIPSVSLHPTATDSPTEFPSTTPSLVPTLSGMPSAFPTSSMPPSVSAVPSNVPSTIPSTTNVPSFSPTGTLKPSVSLVPSVTPSGSVQPSNKPSNTQLDSFTDERLECSANPCGEVGGDDRWSICYVNPQTKMTSSVCVSTTSIYLNGEGEHYCGECQSECHETLDEKDSCDDAHFCTFAVSPTQKERCRWFEDQEPTITAAHCAFNEHMRTLCPETCGSCVDTCEDDPTQRVDINGIMRPCSYLKARPHLRPEVCFPTSDAWEFCQETCGNCEGTLVLSITEDADYDNSLDD